MAKFIRVTTNPKTGEGVFVNFDMVRSMTESRIGGLDVIALKFENGDKIETTDTIRQITAALESKTIVSATS